MHPLQAFNPALILSLAAICLGLIATSGTRAASLVIEADSGLVLHADEATQPWYPASLTKMMTGYLILEAIAQGRLSRKDKLTVSAAAARQPPSKLGLKKGSTISVQQALGAMAVRSANDAAVVLAEALAESEEAAAILMTRKARTLGMRATVFRNASGLPDPGQRTTARDMAVLARALIRDFPEGYAIFGKRSVRVKGRDHATSNRWAAGYKGADGIKTGFTCASGYNLAASALRGGRRLIAVVLGAKTSAVRNVTMTKLMNRGFDTLAEIAAGRKDGAYFFGDLAPANPGTEPPTVLAASTCATQISSSPIKTALTGWGIIFGSFPTKGAATKIARERKRFLKGVIDRGRVAVVPRQREGFLGYSALIVGLGAEDAGRACKHLWTSDLYCLGLAPKVLQNPDALWR